MTYSNIRPSSQRQPRIHQYPQFKVEICVYSWSINLPYVLSAFSPPRRSWFPHQSDRSEVDTGQTFLSALTISQTKSTPFNFKPCNSWAKLRNKKWRLFHLHLFDSHEVDGVQECKLQLARSWPPDVSATLAHSFLTPLCWWRVRYSLGEIKGTSRSANSGRPFSICNHRHFMHFSLHLSPAGITKQVMPQHWANSLISLLSL